MINRFNPHICESFYADKVILVEGDTETIVYRDLIKRFYPKEDIFILNTGSKNNMPFFKKFLLPLELNIVLFMMQIQSSIQKVIIILHGL